MVTSGTHTEGNVDIPIPDSLLTHSQEEADTLLILHAVSVSHEADLVVSSPDTGVLLLLVHMFLHLSLSTVFLTEAEHFCPVAAGRGGRREHAPLAALCSGRHLAG